MTTKTNAARLLEAQGIPHELIAYEVDEKDLSAVAVATKLGQSVDRVFKTLVLRGDRSGVFVCVIPGAAEIDLKKAARASGNRSAAMIAMKELLPLTGYVRGGCSPLGMKKRYPTYIDESSALFDRIFVSAGARGLQLEIAPDDLVRAAACQVADLV